MPHLKNGTRRLKNEGGSYGQEKTRKIIHHAPDPSTSLQKLPPKLYVCGDGHAAPLYNLPRRLRDGRRRRLDDKHPSGGPAGKQRDGGDGRRKPGAMLPGPDVGRGWRLLLDELHPRGQGEDAVHRRRGPHKRPQVWALEVPRPVLGQRPSHHQGARGDVHAAHNREDVFPDEQVVQLPHSVHWKHHTGLRRRRPEAHIHRRVGPDTHGPDSPRERPRLRDILR